MEALNDAIALHRSYWPGELVNWLLDMVSFSLESTYAKYGRWWYKQMDGVATGGTLSVHVANIAVFRVLNMIIYSRPHIQIDFFVRFVDDGTGVWSGSLDSFYWWFVTLNEELKENYNLELTFNISESDNFCVFLDVEYKFVNGKLVTDIHHKATDAHRYLHYTSFHPPHVFRGIVYSQGLRYRRIINDDSKLTERMTELATYFTNSQYPITLVKPILDKLTGLERNLSYNTKSVDKPFHVPYLCTYGAGEGEIGQYINQTVNTALKQAPVFQTLDKPIIKTVFRNAPSLRSTLFNQKKVVLSAGSEARGFSVRCTSEEEARHKKGPKCQTCISMANDNKFTLNGISFNNCDGGDCKSYNMIYLALCTICNLGYFGKTTIPLHKRMNLHRGHIGSIKRLTEIDDDHVLAAHVVMDHQNQLNFQKLYRFFVVKKLANPRDLLKNEQKFINKFKTRRPTGLNIDNPIGISVLRTAP